MRGKGGTAQGSGWRAGNPRTRQGSRPIRPRRCTEGKLYLSMLYTTTVHLCACGCGNEIVLPLSPAEWQLYFDGESVSLTPSVGNWKYPYRSHYWIKANKIRWATPWTDAQVAAGRRRDAEAVDEYVARREAARKAAEPTREAQNDGQMTIKTILEQRWITPILVGRNRQSGKVPASHQARGKRMHRR